MEWQASDAAPKTGARALNEARSRLARSGLFPPAQAWSAGVPAPGPNDARK
jgi:hypothetical protein